MNINWALKSFADLTSQELYAILQLRNEVFVVEQNCVFQDADNKDQISFHVMGWVADRLAAYARLIPAGAVYEEPSVGRVVVAPGERGQGTGYALMQQSIKLIYNIWGKKPIKIGAQLYLEKFYKSLGFQRVSEIYLEDGIEHILMLLDIAP